MTRPVTDTRLTIAIVALLAACACLLHPGQARAAAGAVGEVAPSYEATTLDGGAAVTLAQQRGRAVLLNKWSTWCRPCVQEMPFLQQLQDERGGDEFTVIGVSIDRPGSDANVRRVAGQRGVTYPLWLDPQDTFTQTFRSSGVPESVLVDRDGVVVRRWAGAIDESDPTVERAIDRAIASKGDYAGSAKRETKSSSKVEFGIVGILAAILAGVLSFLSPCVLPLVPSYVAFLAGVSGAEARGAKAGRRATMMHAISFVLGFSAVFVSLGLSATAVGALFRDEGELISRIGGVLLIVFGLVLIGMIPLGLLQQEARLLHRAQALRRIGIAGSFVVGAAFAAGWTPCIGPVLAGILALAATGSTGQGAALLAAYSLGLAVPFLAAAFAIDKFNLAAPRMRRWLPWVNRVSGALLIVLGVLLVTGAMSRLSTWFARFTPSWLG